MIRKMLTILACALALACSNNPGNSNNSAAQGSSPSGQSYQTPSGEIVFGYVQPVGQKSLYSMIMNTSTANETPTGMQAVDLKMNLDFETEVTASNPDGTWDVKNKFSNVNMEANQNGNRVSLPAQMLEGKSFTTTMDRNGQVVRTSDSDLGAGVNLDQMFSQMSVSGMLPKKPIRVGESWPFEIKQEVPGEGGGTATQVMTGTGTLKEVTNNVAQVDYQFKVEIIGSISGSGPGSGALSYDLSKSRVVESRSDIEISGQMQIPGQDRPRKNTTKASIEMRLRGE